MKRMFYPKARDRLLYRASVGARVWPRYWLAWMVFRQRLGKDNVGRLLTLVERRINGLG